MNQIYAKGEFCIFPSGKNYIIINRRKHFKYGHTHVNSIGLAKRIIHLVIKNEISPSLSPYLLTSCMRISDNKDYIDKIQEILLNKERRKNNGTRYKNDSRNTKRYSIKN